MALDKWSAFITVKLSVFGKNGRVNPSPGEPVYGFLRSISWLLNNWSGSCFLRSISWLLNNWSGSAQFAIKYANLCQQSGSGNLIAWKNRSGRGILIYSAWQGLIGLKCTVQIIKPGLLFTFTTVWANPADDFLKETISMKCQSLFFFFFFFCEKKKKKMTVCCVGSESGKS